MKKLIIALLLPLCVFAQDEMKQTQKEKKMKSGNYNVEQLQVKEAQAEMSLGINSALVLILPDASASKVEKFIKSELKQYKSKVSDSKNEISTLTATGTGIGIGEIEIYAIVEESDMHSSLITFFYYDGQFIDSEEQPDEYENAEQLLLNFGRRFQESMVNDELELEIKSYDKLTKELKRLKKQNEDHHKDIERFKRLIVEEEESIVKNDKAQNISREAIHLKNIDVDFVKWKLKAF